MPKVNRVTGPQVRVQRGGHVHLSRRPVAPDNLPLCDLLGALVGLQMRVGFLYRSPGCARNRKGGVRYLLVLALRPFRRKLGDDALGTHDGAAGAVEAKLAGGRAVGIGRRQDDRLPRPPRRIRHLQASIRANEQGTPAVLQEVIERGLHGRVRRQFHRVNWRHLIVAARVEDAGNLPVGDAATVQQIAHRRRKRDVSPRHLLAQRHGKAREAIHEAQFVAQGQVADGPRPHLPREEDHRVGTIQGERDDGGGSGRHVGKGQRCQGAGAAWLAKAHRAAGQLARHIHRRPAQGEGRRPVFDRAA